MKISRKTLVVVLCTSIVLFLTMFVISEVLFRESYERLEEKYVEENLQRAVGALDANIDGLNAYATDWSMWDDTYYFAVDRNEDYIKNNLTDTTFEGGKINLMLIFNLSGRLVYSKAYDLSNEKEMPIPLEIIYYGFDIINAGLVSNYETGVSGIVSSFKDTWLISAQPILTSTGEGPSVGIFIAGRVLNQDFVDSLSETTQLSLAFNRLDEPQIPAPAKAAIHSISSETPIFIQPLSSNTVAGYRLLNDINGTPSLMLIMDMPREIYRQGITIILYFQIFLAVACFLFILIFMLILRKTVLSRVINLNNRVNDISRTNDISRRLPVSGSDEISDLSISLNNMLNSLGKYQKLQKNTSNLINRILASEPNGVLVINNDHQIILANKAFGSLCDQHQDKLKGKTIEEIAILNELLPFISETQSGTMTDLQHEFKCEIEGHDRIFIANIIPIEKKEILLLLNEVTEARERQAKLSLNERLVSVGEMASGIAHELNNPLTSVIGLSQMLINENVPKDVKEDLEIISSEAHRAAVIVKNLLTFARKRTPEIKQTQINQLLDDILKLRAYEHKVNNIQIKTSLDPDLPPVMADHFQMQQVFLNLVLNAEYAMIEAHKQGTLSISTQRVDGHIKISVADDGPGISPENMKHLFNPFFTTKEVGKGTGLGLSICYGTVTNHGGRIYANSQPGQGATFVIELPVNSQREGRNTDDGQCQEKEIPCGGG